MEEKKCYDPSEYNGLDTPLHYAASSGKEEVVQYLIVQQSFDCNAKGNFERTPLHSACRGGHLQVIEYLTKIANADLLWRDCKFDLTPLDLAAEHAPLNVMVNEMCCQVKFRDKNRDTVLHHAARPQ